MAVTLSIAPKPVEKDPSHIPLERFDAIAHELFEQMLFDAQTVGIDVNATGPSRLNTMFMVTWGDYGQIYITNERVSVSEKIDMHNGTHVKVHGIAQRALAFKLGKAEGEHLLRRATCHLFAEAIDGRTADCAERSLPTFVKALTQERVEAWQDILWQTVDKLKSEVFHDNAVKVYAEWIMRAENDNWVDEMSPILERTRTLPGKDIIRKMMILRYVQERAPEWKKRSLHYLNHMETCSYLDETLYAFVMAQCEEGINDGNGLPIELAQRITDLKKKNRVLLALLDVYAYGIDKSSKKYTQFLFHYQRIISQLDPNNPNELNLARQKFIHHVADMIVKRKDLEPLASLMEALKAMTEGNSKNQAVIDAVRARSSCTGHTSWYGQAINILTEYTKDTPTQNICWVHINEGVRSSPFHPESYDHAIRTAARIKENPRLHDTELLLTVQWITSELSVNMWKHPHNTDPYDKAVETAKSITDKTTQEVAYVDIAMRCIDTKGVRWSHRAKEMVKKLDKESPNIQLVASQLAQALEAAHPRGWEKKLTNIRRLSQDCEHPSPGPDEATVHPSKEDCDALHELSLFVGEYSDPGQSDI
jgi:hypothetical protein